MPVQTYHHTLAAKRPRSGSDPLLGFLQSALGHPVTLDVSGVNRLDSLRLRTLLSAQNRWAADGQPFVVQGITDGFADGLTRLGLPEGYLKGGAA